MIVPFPAGGGADAVGRIVAERMRGLIGQPIVIENIGGADGSIGVGRAARARPDGYTIVLGPMETHVLNGAFYSLSYDVVNDFTPVAPLITQSIILFSRKGIPAQNNSIPRRGCSVSQHRRQRWQINSVSVTADEMKTSGQAIGNATYRRFK